jgi:hypothetical protein
MYITFTEPNLITTQTYQLVGSIAVMNGYRYIPLLQEYILL